MYSVPCTYHLPINARPDTIKLTTIETLGDRLPAFPPQCGPGLWGEDECDHESVVRRIEFLFQKGSSSGENENERPLIEVLLCGSGSDRGVAALNVSKQTRIIRFFARLWGCLAPIEFQSVIKLKGKERVAEITAEGGECTVKRLGRNVVARPLAARVVRFVEHVCAREVPLMDPDLVSASQDMLEYLRDEDHGVTVMEALERSAVWKLKRTQLRRVREKERDLTDAFLAYLEFIPSQSVIVRRVARPAPT